MDPDSLENLDMADKLKIVDFFRECVRRTHSDILRVQKLGKSLKDSCTNEKNKTKIEELIKILDTIYGELGKVL